MESEQFFTFSPSIAWASRANCPVQFSCGCLAPSPEAQDTVSFRLEDILYTAASDSEDFGAVSLDRFPGLGSSPSPLASLMRQSLTSPTPLVLWSRGMPQSRRSRTR